MNSTPLMPQTATPAAGAAALLTTFGVGELSAINGTAGSYAEYLPVIHIVGAPSQQAQRRGDLIHHSLGDGDFSHFLRMQREVTVAQAALTADNACAEIDRVITEALTQRRPGYLLLPVDVAGASVQAPRQSLAARRETDPQALAAFRAAAEKRLSSARSVSLLADFLADRFGVQQQLAHWLEAVPLPHATLLMGKGVLDEQRRGFVGTYAGEGCAQATRKAIEQADAIISVGVRFTDTITVGFSQRIDPERNIDLQPFSATVAGERFAPLAMTDAVAELQQLCQRYADRWTLACCDPAPLAQPEQPGLTQNAFWQAMQAFLQPGDLILGGAGHRRLRGGGAASACRGEAGGAAAMGIYRLYFAGDLRRPDGGAGPARDLADWRRLRAADGAGVKLNDAR